MAIRLLLVDDHPIVLQGLQQLFSREADFEVAGTCRTAEEAIAAIGSLAPDVVVLDLRMPGASGIDVLKRAPRGNWRTVMLTAAIKDDEVVQVLDLGASGIVLKESSPSALVECVRQVNQGRQWIDPEMLGRGLNNVLRGEGTPPPGATLTPREREIVRLVAEGLRNREIAGRLSISEGTVKIHLHNVYDKLGVDGRLELVLAAQQKGLV
jgi:two-component system NarL family response regulator/two-component system nitrate/nitrite response regulator NarL